MNNSAFIKEQYKVALLRKGVDPSAASTAHIGISMSNPKHSGVKLATLINWAAYKYDTVQVNLHDSLQRHNILSLSLMSEEKAYKQALLAGDSWISANAHILTPYKNVTLKRRDDLLALFPNVKERLSILETLYDSDFIFSSLIDHEILSYLDRKQAHEGEWTSEKIQRFFAHSKSYILDELALMSLLNETEDFVEIYAGTFLNMLKDPELFKVKSLPQGLKHYPMVEVDFTRFKGNVPKLEVG